MSPSLTKVIYKPDSQSTDEFIIIVNPQVVGVFNLYRHFSHPNLWFIVEEMERRR